MFIFGRSNARKEYLTANFDEYTSNQADVLVTVAFNGNELNGNELNGVLQ